MSTVTAAASRVEGVHYRVSGEGPDTVVLLHGFADNLSTWDRVVPPLAVEHRVIAIDLPGFGLSARRWSRPLLPGYVEAVREVLDAEGVTGPVSLMGNSMGAVVSALFARRYPQRTAAVVLVDMPGLHTVPRLWRMAMSKPAELSLRAGLRVVPSWVPQRGVSMFYGRIAAAHPGNLAPSVRRGFASPYRARGSVASILPIGRVLLAELRSADLSRVVGLLGAPVLIVFGSRDVLTPARVMRRIGRPGGAVVLPSCGHCPQIDQPQALLANVVPFLREAGREPATSASRTA